MAIWQGRGLCYTARNPWKDVGSLSRSDFIAFSDLSVNEIQIILDLLLRVTYIKRKDYYTAVGDSAGNCEIKQQ